MVDKPEHSELVKTTAESIAKPSSGEIWASILAKAVAGSTPFAGSILGTLLELRKKELPEATRAAWPKTLAEEKVTLVKELIESGIDPAAFDVLISNEMNRRLKVRFGVAFLVLTLLFTAASYSIVILDGIHEWKISSVAITALIIETPIQFIGLLYIIARNLFPQRKEGKTTTSGFPKRIAARRARKSSDQSAEDDASNRAP